MAGLMPSRFPSKRWITPLNPLLSLSVAEHDIIWHGISLCLVQVISQVVSPPNLLHTSQSIHCGGRVRNSKGLDAVQTLLRKS